MAGSKKISCWLCDGTGIYKKPTSEQAYDEKFEYYDKMGCFSQNVVREKALKDVGYTEEECPDCHGSGTVDSIV